MSAFKKTGQQPTTEAESALDTTRNVSVTLRGRVHTMTVDIGEMTPGLRRRLATGKSASPEAAEDATVEVITRCVASWDIEDRQGAVIDLTDDAVREGLSYNAMDKVVKAIIEGPNAAGATPVSEESQS